MNGNGSDADAILEDLDEMTETDELEVDDAIAEGETAEFLPFLPFPPFGGRRRRPQVGGGQSYMMARPQAYYVTQPQLQAALTRVRNDVAKNGRAITAVNTRVNGLQTQTARQGRELANQGKINARQTREIAAARTEIKNGLKKAQDNNLLLFLLTRPKATTAAVATTGGFDADGANIPQGHKILIQPEKDNTLLLALALGGGLGGDGGDSSGLLLALAISGGL